ncbi:lytic transglycosylase domain-containing protein [Olsenella sp. An290]|uniref:lytic transglycosylase domain-containing protein n=1 Tax=Olsenella sp. An290 TaxID=1965625 RepID=UPI001EF452B3|nr:lytic transglycosylase domain-containing protein [Olsenella sp. An290]
MPRRRRREPFWRWYRVVPALALGVTLLVCGALAALPSQLGRALFYPVHHAETIESAAERHGLDPNLVCAVIKCESGWDEEALSPVGAVGLMQVMPSTAQSLADMGLVDASSYDPASLSDPRVNIEYGCTYLSYLQRNLSSIDEIVAAYNAGLGAVQGWLSDGGSIPEGIEYEETRTYLGRVRDALEGYEKSYPAGITE